jgi:quercetin dioxygenase-like cupin family protein
MQSTVTSHAAPTHERTPATTPSPSLKERIERRVARFADRREDWTVFGFETEKDPKFGRAQRRYIGASGSVDPNDRRGGLEPSAFTMSIQSMPAGNRIPIHRHEIEETFFILGGSCVIRLFDGDEVAEVRLGKWDLIACPPFMYHEIINDGAETCHLQTLLSKVHPLRPDYQDKDLLRLQAAVT